jgi:outer membrane protein
MAFYRPHGLLVKKTAPQLGEAVPTISHKDLPSGLDSVHPGQTAARITRILERLASGVPLPPSCCGIGLGSHPQPGPSAHSLLESGKLLSRPAQALRNSYNTYMFKPIVLSKPIIPIALALCAGMQAEVHTMTLRQAVERAMEQNPEVAMSRFDEIKAQEAVRQQRDPFLPRIMFGSGLAYTNGFPLSIDGAAPSVIQGRASQYLFNRQQSYVVAQAKEQAHTADISAAAKKDDVAYRTASLYLDAERAGRALEMARQQTQSLDQVLATIHSRVEEGRELAIESKRAELNLARARQTADALEADGESLETSLAIVLGYSADDRVHPAREDRTGPEMPATEESAVESALQSSKDLRRLQSEIVAKGLEIRSDKAARLPRVDLVAEYALFATYNHYQDYFLKYQRNNGELGVSVQLPILPGPGVGAAVAQADADIAKLRIQMDTMRNQIAADTRKAFREIHKAQSAQEVARLDLELAREQLSVNLALMHEGRLSLRLVEESRIAESDKWVAFYDTQYAFERARWSLARETGNLVAALQ